MQPEIDSDKYNKILQDNRILSKELQNLKNQLDSYKDSVLQSQEKSSQLINNIK